MAARNNDDQRPYHIEHHYLDVYYDDIFLVGCTSTRAYAVTRTGREEYFAHSILLKNACGGHDLLNGRFLSKWHHYTETIQNYLHACAHEAMLCVLTSRKFLLFNSSHIHYEHTMKFGYIDACAMNNRYVVVVYDNRHVMVYDYLNDTLVCNRIFDHSVDACGQKILVSSISFLCTQEQTFIVTTSDNKTLFYNVIDKNIQLHRNVVLLETDKYINFTHELRPHLLATCSSHELHIVRSVDGRIEHLRRRDFPASIVDVVVVSTDNEYVVVHDIEGDLQLLNWRLETESIITHQTLFKPHNECLLPVHRIQRAYHSMTSCPEASNILMILLPSADLCVIKFS